MTDLLLKFPALWAVLGLLVGGFATAVVILIITRKYAPLQVAALDGLVKVYEKQLAANTAALETQKTHFEDEIEILRGEREDYKKKLHDSRDQNQAIMLQVADLQARPNVDQVYKGQQEFFQKNTDCMEALLKLVKDHDAGIEERTKAIIQPVIDVCAQIVTALNGHALKRVARK